MDFWVVAAATGAGYVAKNWQNLSGEKDSSLTLSPVLTPRVVQPDAHQLFGKMPNSVFQLPKLATKYLLEGDVYSPEEDHKKEEMDFHDHNKLLVSGSAPMFIEKRVYQDNVNEINGMYEYEYLDISSHHLHKLRTKHTNVKSFSSLRPLILAGNSRDCQIHADNMNDDHKIMFTEENEAFFEPVGSAKLPRRQKLKFETRDHAQGNNMLSLFVGITIGILSSIVTNQHEVEHLNELLEQAENMVRDLHNKLEMKDKITPKSEKLELTSDIEAELEAELEKLEENMKDYTLQRLSNVVEHKIQVIKAWFGLFLQIDSDFEADMARGDLNLDALTWQIDSQSESDHGDKEDKNESTGKPVFTPNYVVSPLDLRLRLHELIESELRARIEELEAVLENQNSQRKLSSPEAPEPQEDNSFWDFDHTRIESSSSTP